MYYLSRRFRSPPPQDFRTGTPVERARAMMVVDEDIYHAHLLRPYGALSCTLRDFFHRPPSRFFEKFIDLKMTAPQQMTALILFGKARYIQKKKGLTEMKGM